MPIVDDRPYPAAGLRRNRHFQTISPRFFRKTELRYQRQELSLADGDFIDLDWSIKDFDDRYTGL